MQKFGKTLNYWIHAKIVGVKNSQRSEKLALSPDTAVRSITPGEDATHRLFLLVFQNGADQYTVYEYTRNLEYIMKTSGWINTCISACFRTLALLQDFMACSNNAPAIVLYEYGNYILLLLDRTGIYM